ncbi:hypothetical protein SAMN04488527_1647 [Aliiroseovarius crassostreae]|uniref:Uncharacterized protein n=1 Tax=Aliiroseovarius crassostreae TaxID=154981 RepID=A0A0P7IGF3_9RHOB|nr:hypothetical protein [Aliiroseovarius crassostreae]KPN62912.1 hypothetical protein AKJ29_01845 [Aliiroseovarius crassostreae]SFU97979.1 hypothetical protein SAMN04488527_1647 [Aliiroseovarius crassostreae]
MTKRKFSLFKPRLPRVSGLGDTTKSSATWAREAFSRSGSRCPIEGCGGTLTILDVIDGEEGDAQAVRSLVCQKCNTSQPIDHLIDRAAAQIDGLRSGERIFFISGMALFIVFTVMAFLNGSFLTLFGGAVFALLLIMRGFVFRYKAWQATNRKMFEDRPPVLEWLREEFGKNVINDT